MAPKHCAKLTEHMVLGGLCPTVDIRHGDRRLGDLMKLLLRDYSTAALPYFTTGFLVLQITRRASMMSENFVTTFGDG